MTADVQSASASTTRGRSDTGIDLEKLPVERVLATLAVQADRGLSSEEVVNQPLYPRAAATASISAAQS